MSMLSQNRRNWLRGFAPRFKSFAVVSRPPAIPSRRRRNERNGGCFGNDSKNGHANFRHRAVAIRDLRLRGGNYFRIGDNTPRMPTIAPALSQGTVILNAVKDLRLLFGVQRGDASE